MLQLEAPQGRAEGALGDLWQQGQHLHLQHITAAGIFILHFKYFLYLFILFPIFSIALSEKGLVVELLQYGTLLHATPVPAMPFKSWHQGNFICCRNQCSPKAAFDLSALLPFHSMNTYFSCSVLVEIGSDLIIGISTSFSSLLQKGNGFNTS